VHNIICKNVLIVLLLKVVTKTFLSVKKETNVNLLNFSKEEIAQKIENCPINYTMNKIGGKWKPIILHRIRIGINRFGALQRAIPFISKQMLTAQLRELEADNLIERKIFAEVPPRVEYSISTNGESVFPLLEAIEQWGSNQQKLDI